MTSPFVHLHVHSHYSLLSALPRIKELVHKAKDLGMTSLALTDNGNMYGAIDFYKTCKKNDIKPIVGVDFYTAARARTDKEPGIDNRRNRLVLLAKNHEGYKNLIKLVTHSHTEGFYYKPRVDDELLERYKSDLIAIVPAFNSQIRNHIDVGALDEARAVIEKYRSWYGTDSVFIEITHHPEVEGYAELMKKTIAFARDNNIPLVASNDVQYIAPEDQPARRTLMLIQSAGGGRAASDTADFSFKSGEDMKKLFTNTPDAIENTAKIADMCNLEIELEVWKFPNYPIASGRTADDELRHLAYEGATKRGLALEGTAKERLEYELSIISKKGYSIYFLVVADLLREARERGILTTIRGSVAGSLTTYVTGITNVDPLEYKLPFERFLNPDRPSAPDIDMDYADNRRDEILAYVREKYGEDKVAQIGTFGTMLARGSVRDTARAMGYEHSLADAIAKLIPMGSQGFPMTIERALKEEPELKKMYTNDEDARRIIDMARKVEGCARHISVHAAGVVISPIPLEELVPVQYDPKGEGKLITQYDMHAVGEDNVGLLKFDFLGIRNLAILADAVKRVKKIYGVDIDIENIPLDDPKTFGMLARGETEGIFQLNGSGMTKFLVELKPTTIHDINAMVALYRPGPLEMIPEYIARKHDPSKVRYLDPRMQPILERSHGVITYQDDVMLIAIQLGGFSWIEADKLRKAMGKKIPELMAEQHAKLTDGLVEHGMSREKAEELWQLITPFAAYGFNKAHAASYGRVAYQTAYMKANYPTAYMASILSAESGDVDKIAEIISECKRMDIEVLPPDVNESLGDFSVVTKEMTDDGKERIRFGLNSIKNFGEGVALSIIDERKANGPYETLADFLTRVKDKNLNKKALESLIKAGALDAFGERGAMLGNLDKLLAHHKHAQQHSGDQSSLFGAAELGITELKLETADEARREDKLAWEKELLGLYISGHPLDTHKALMEGTKLNTQNLSSLPPGVTVILYGHIDDVKVIVTKKGDKMAFVTLSDYEGTAEIVVFPSTYEESKDTLVPNTCVGVKGKVNARNGEMSVLAEKIKKL